MIGLLKQLSEAVPELCSWRNHRFARRYKIGFWHTDTVEGRICAIAAIRDWIVARYGQVIVYDTLVLTRKFSWKVYDIVAEQYVYESGAHEDELQVAIDCALAVAKERME